MHQTEDKNIQILLDAFQNQKKLSVSNMQHILSCNRQTVYNYLTYLRDRGYTINTEKCGRTQFYFLDTAALPDLPITPDILRNYSIIQVLQNGPVKRDTFSRCFLLDSSAADLSDKIPLDIHRTSFFAYLKKLTTSGEIILDKDSETYYLSGKTIPLRWFLDPDHLYDIYDEICNIPPDSAYSEQISSLRKKLNFFMGSMDNPYTTESNYIVYGRSHTAYRTMKDKLALLGKYDYQHKLLKIQFEDQNHFPLQVTLALGLIVYCLEKDSIYLLGEDWSASHPVSDRKDIIIHLDRVTGILETSQEHNVFNCEKFIQIYETMFSISTDPPVDVCVEFELFGNVENKVNILHRQRPHSTITYNEDNSRITYRDTIRGLQDFAAYLRRFGKSVMVISPPQLKEKMMFSIKNSLERYKEEEQ